MDAFYISVDAQLKDTVCITVYKTKQGGKHDINQQNITYTT